MQDKVKENTPREREEDILSATWEKPQPRIRASSEPMRILVVINVIERE